MEGGEAMWVAGVGIGLEGVVVGKDAWEDLIYTL